MNQAVTNEQINCVAQILEGIAKELRTGDRTEWEDLSDCIRATVNNVEHDLRNYQKGIPVETLIILAEEG